MNKALFILFIGVFLFPSTAFADELPWAAQQPLSEITGLNFSPGWEDKAVWQTSFVSEEEDLPAFFDWRSYADGLTPVKRQRANDCWAQGTVGVLESLVKIATAEEVDLSVQEVISCSGEGTARSGGDFAHEYHRQHGSVTNDEFPYLGRDTTCKRGLKPSYFLSKWGYVGYKNRSPTVVQMKQAIMEHGPIGVTIAANSALQRFTGDGVFHGCSDRRTNHIEVIVGWDDSEEDGVWFVRNSWGKDHGRDGYAKIPYGCSRVGDVSTWADLQPID